MIANKKKDEGPITKKIENWTEKWIRPNMILNISHFGLELGHLRRKKRRGEEEKKRREEEKKKKKEKRKERRRSFLGMDTS